MIDNLKPFGGFIENTIRPILDELHWLFEEMDKKGLKVTESNLLAILNKVAYLQIITLLLDILKSVLVAGIVCYSLWKMRA